MEKNGLYLSNFVFNDKKTNEKRHCVKILVYDGKNDLGLINPEIALLFDIPLLDVEPLTSVIVTYEYKETYGKIYKKYISFKEATL